ncbi:YfiR family protein [Rhodanobacter sp. L36]|uniref:YfiR family protein n=1 Tax=Rhodanobacter sp. L36 TaxID=1747221 RepID=UPI001C2085E2|nr:YfiR family protein [Rhodanobacter sp. L36]
MRTQAVTTVVLGIISYTHWPTSAQQLRICVLANPAYASDLLNGTHLSGGQSIIAQHMDVENPDIGRDCAAVYLGALTDDQRMKLFTELSGHPVLSISEADLTCASGSMFCLRFDDSSKVRFATNLDSVARSGVRVDPHVLLLSHSRTEAQP